jgi:hypothetical protein
MKKLFLFLLCLPIFVIAQDGINYQGAATDNNGDELINQNITLRASIISGSVNGNLEWEETHSTSTDQFGLFSVVIGQGTNTSNGSTSNFDNMDWGSGNHFLKIEMDASGGTNYSIIGTTQMMSVPYALYAKSSGSNSNLDSLGQVVTILDSLMAIITPYLGCTDSTACNYDSLAVINNGSCTGLFGCTDNQSSNYNASATCDDGSCIPYVGMYAFGGVIYDIVGNQAYVFNIDHEVSQSSMTTTSLSNYSNGLALNGYSDWEVPNSTEYNVICANMSLINIITNLNGGIVLTSTDYWSTSGWCSQSSPSYIPYARPYGMSWCGEWSSGCPAYGPFLTRVHRSFTF